ncbi:MAG TPA: hypothetical protein V6C58_11885, partial [Allocoleopsis sp.]
YCVKRVLAKKGLYEIKKFIQLAKLEGRLSQKEIEIVGRNINILKEVLQVAGFNYAHWYLSPANFPPTMVKKKYLVYIIEGFYTNKGYLPKGHILLHDPDITISGYQTKWHIIWGSCETK